jgi:hypothetical protein
MNNGETMRGTFSPGCGNIKPDTRAIRRLIFDEGPRCVERREWQEVEDDYEDCEVESEGCEESESDHQALVSK